jgi:hypothetical protein
MVIVDFTVQGGLVLVHVEELEGRCANSVWWPQFLDDACLEEKLYM